MDSTELIPAQRRYPTVFSSRAGPTSPRRGHHQDGEIDSRDPAVSHQTDAAIAGHLFCSFLAMLLRKELDEHLATAGVQSEWDDIVRDLDRVEQIELEQNGKRFVLRPHTPGCAGSLFQAVGAALPPLLRQLPPARQPPDAASPAPQRRGRPRRGATSA
ncbi:MAG: hypothetical protein JOY71_13900 [Acetobacteraceae bacterium]|nr:hypothetical protein [Acetobacteraceae bacterium]MBV8589340.1 hypothetical protein [Acetobacteraceae bacterium]